MSAPLIRSVQTHVVTIARDVPYLGPLGAGERINERGYLVRKGNRTIYPTVDRSVMVEVTLDDGRIGWGETYGIVAPNVIGEIVADVFAPMLKGRAPVDVPALWQELYDLMRVRGHWSGFYTDALAAVDVALWDVCAKVAGCRVVDMLGGAKRTRVPAYASGLPRATLGERVELARELVANGFKAVKFAAVVSHAGVIEEMRALRAALGDDVEIMVDLHWKYSPQDAIGLIRDLAPYRPRFAEAPCAPEDIDGQAEVAANVDVPIAGGEEWSTEFQVRPRLAMRCVGVIQPEVAHTGLSQFMAISRMAAAGGVQVMPHATIGVGIFHAASLHGAAALDHVEFHEHQHSVFGANVRLLETSMACADGAFVVPAGLGLGVEPRGALRALMRPARD